VTFSIANASTVCGQLVYVVGNQTPLGSWTPAPWESNQTTPSGNRAFTTPTCDGSVARWEGSSRF